MRIIHCPICAGIGVLVSGWSIPDTCENCGGTGHIIGADELASLQVLPNEGEFGDRAS